ncbi:hypothetical protein ACFL6C_00105 [Myxococcota bacterium]
MRLRTGLVAAAVLLTSTQVEAGGRFEKVETGSPHFLGEVYRYRVEWDDIDPPQEPVNRTDVYLPPALVLLEIRDENNEPLPGFAASELPRCGAPPYSCPRDTTTDPNIELATGGTTQLVRLTRPNALVWPDVLLVVRMQDSSGCGPPSAEWYDDSVLEDFQADAVFQTACLAGDTLQSISITSANPIVTWRRATPVSEPITVAAQPTQAVLNQLTFQCDLAGQPFDCDSAQFRAVATLTPRLFPETIPPGADIVAANQPDPPEGIQEATIHIGVPESDTWIQVTLQITQQDADTLSISGPDPATIEAGEGALLRVDSALNADGGYESATAFEWGIESVVPDDPDLRDLLTVSMSNDHEALLQTSSAIPFDNTPEYRITLFALHQNPNVAPTRGTTMITVTPAPVTPSCRLVAERGRIGVHGQTRLRMEIRGDGDWRSVASVETWRVVAGHGMVADDSQQPAEAVFRASERVGNSSVRATSTQCPDDGSATMEIQVQELLDLRLVAKPAEVLPGGVVRLEALVENRTDEPLEGLRFAFRLPKALKAIRRVARGGGGISTRPLDAVIGGPSPKPGTSSFSADVVPGETAKLSFPAIARSGFGGQPVRIWLDVYYAQDQTRDDQTVPSAVRSVWTEIAIENDPEASEATLFGKVFHDRNGDSVQQAGETGIPGAMVAVSAGLYALTDEHGKYHIARLEPGRHAVKINLGTLPFGVEPTTDVRRDVTLTPGTFTKINYGVRIPDVTDRRPLTFVPGGSGLRLVEGRPIYTAELTHVAGAELVARSGEHQRVTDARGSDGRALDIPLDRESPMWMLVERGEDGRLWLASWGVFVHERPEGGTLILPWGPRPIARLLLPPPGRRVNADELVVAGDLLAPAAITISVGEGQSCDLSTGAEEVQSDAVPIRCVLPVTTQLDSLEIRVDPLPDAKGVDAPEQTVHLPVQVDPTVHFFVGIGSLEMGLALHRENDAESLVWPGGTAAFFYRGFLEGGYTLTAGADARADDVLFVRDKKTGRRKLRSLGGIGARLLAHDPRRVFRDLDPEDYYPTYGDGSQTVDERESGGRFFLRVQKDDSYLKWGGINTAIDDAEVGRFVRSLYGMGSVLRLQDEDADLRLGASVFAAQPESVAARDELTVTGGTLYFLGHRDLVEGSLRVTLEVLDEVSGLPVRAVPLVEGSDYEADYAGGRIVLDSALPYRFFGASLTGDGAGGHRGRLLVEYEYVTSSSLTADWSMGARVTGGWGPVTLGATGVTELTGLDDGVGELRGRYWLVGGTARLDLGDPLKVRLELAHSDGGSHDARRSFDGGLTFSDTVRGDGKSGNAVAIELSTGFDSASGSLYGRYVEPGFSDSRTSPGRRLVQGGVRVAATLPSHTRVWGSFDHRETRLRDTSLVSAGAGLPATGLDVRDLGIVGVSQRLGDWSLEVEGRHELRPKREAHRTLAAAELAYRVSSAVSLSVRRLQLVATDENGLEGDTAAGVLVENAGGWRLAAEVGSSDELDVFGRAQGTVPVTEDTELYAGYQVASHLGSSFDDSPKQQGTGIVAGGRRSLDDGTLVYSEQSLRMDGRDRLLTRTVGARVPVTARTNLSLTYERGSLDRDDVLAGSVLRDAASVGGSYAGERITARLGADGRLDRKDDDRSAELAAHGRVELQATRDLTVALAARGGSGYRDSAGGDLHPGRRAWEGAFGFALRPVDWDTINIFGRYALVHERDRGEDGSGEWLQSTSHVIAGALVYDIWGPLAVSPKVAYRNTQVSGDGAKGTDQALLAALRGDLHVTESWDATLEGRVCAVPGSRHDTRVGALAEASLLVLQWLRLGAGYNFSEISAQGVQCEEPGARGLFIRAEAVY